MHPISPRIHIHIPLKYDVLKMEPYLFSMVCFGSLRYFKMGGICPVAWSAIWMRRDREKMLMHFMMRKEDDTFDLP